MDGKYILTLTPSTTYLVGVVNGRSKSEKQSNRNPKINPMFWRAIVWFIPVCHRPFHCQERLIYNSEIHLTQWPAALTALHVGPLILKYIYKLMAKPFDHYARNKMPPTLLFLRFYLNIFGETVFATGNPGCNQGCEKLTATVWASVKTSLIVAFLFTCCRS